MPSATRALLRAALLLLVAPAAAHAQVFLASRPHPDFTIGPLFVIATVRPELSPVTVTVAWSVTPAPNKRAADIEQDLFLLWPGEVSQATAPGAADPALASDLESRGFVVVSSGRLALRSRDRLQMGTSEPGELLPESASFVTFMRRVSSTTQVGAGTYIKIPWTTKLADPLAVMSMAMGMRTMLTPKPATWFEELFWGRRWVLSNGFGDIGSLILPIYPLYYEHRDRVVHLAREFSLLTAIFADASHLRIEEISPATATRRPSTIRTGNEIISMPLAAADGTAPQVLKVQFSYFSGQIAWRPILVGAALLLLGNVAGFLMLSRDVTKVIRNRLRLRRRATTDFTRPSGAMLPRGLADTIVPGTTREADLLALYGPPDEEHDRRGPGSRRTLIYRGTRLIPRSERALGPLAAAGQWQEEHHELQIDLSGDRVSAVHSRIRRGRVAS
ncbi:MAG TPA: hypothetical protein VGU22_02325 [Methylomirabilota bacterium]|nr:hypothetical protein [Methylomirabilota bacterium]